MGGFSDPDYNRDRKISDLRLRMQNLESEVHALRSETVPKCFQCGEQITFQALVFRCGDCSMPFHQRCLKSHFANEAISQEAGE
jgi:predicted RNA-binding Zn-ribbon protein involved in translation (DUF1610 family)